ncbi:MAG TPA: protein kinase [bacterium]|nr:protein kinase [bacterium]
MTRYTVKGEKGRGGIGRVLIALDERIGREIALKELIPPGEKKPDMITPDEGPTRTAALRFLREARVTGQLEHPGIVPVYEIGAAGDGTPYYTMRLVRGETLSSAIRAAKTLRDRLRLLPHFRDICNAIAYAHSRGVVHRDIKPDNIMIGQFGETVVLDWGLAKVHGQADDRAGEMAQELSALRETHGPHTVTGKAFGTPAYMSPEQARGSVDEIDERSDIYSLGAVLHEILTGEPPFSGHTVGQIIDRVLKDRPPAITELEPEAPLDLCAVVEKTLAKDKQERYQSAREVAQEIGNYMAGGRIGAYDYSSWELLQRFIRKNRTLSALIGATLILFVGAAITIFSAWRNAVENERTANLNLALGYQENADRMLQERRYDKAEIYAAAALGHTPWNPLSPYRFPDIAIKPWQEIAHNTLSARSSLYLARMNRDDALVSILQHPGGEISDIAIAPDGAIAALAGRDGSVTLWNIADRTYLDCLSGHRDEITSLVFSRDGKLLFSASWDKTIRIWDIPSRTELATLNGHTEEIYALALSADDHTIISGGNDGSIRFWDIPTRRQLSEILLVDAKIRALAVSPNGAAIAAGSATGELFMLRGRTIARYRPHNESLIALRYSADGERLFTASYDKRALMLNATNLSTIKSFTYWDAFYALDIDSEGKLAVLASRDASILLWDTVSGKAESLRGHDAAVQAAAISPDGDSLLSAGADGTLRFWRTQVVRSSRLFTGHRTYIPSIALSPDNRSLASSSWDRTVKIWDIASERELRSIPCAEVCHAVAFSPDGTLLAIAGQDKHIRLFNASDFTIIASLEGHEDGVYSIAFSPDGKFLVSGSWDRTVRLWDVSQKRTIRMFNDHASSVHTVAFSPDGKLIASAGRDKVIIVRRVSDGTNVALLAGHLGNILSVAFSPDGKHLASAGESAEVLIHRLTDGAKVFAFETLGATVNSIAYSPDGRYLLSVGVNALLWDVRDGAEVLRLPLMHTGYAAAFTADGSHFALSEGIAIRLYPVTFDLWEKDPAILLREAEERAHYRLEGFRTIIAQ